MSTIINGTTGVNKISGSAFAEWDNGIKNLIINGNFQVWQRGTAFSSVSGVFTADRWFSWQTLPLTVNKVDAGAEMTFPSASEALLEYRFEERDAKNLVGKTVTLSIDVDTTGIGDGNTNCYLYARNSAGSWAWTADTIYMNNGVNTLTIAVPDDASLTRFRIRISNNDGAAYNAGTLVVKNIQLEQGSTATSFEQRPFGLELLLCQRYYQRSTSPEIVGDYLDATWNSRNALTSHIKHNDYYDSAHTFYVPMRAAPTLSTFGTSSSSMARIEIPGVTNMDVAESPTAVYVTQSGFYVRYNLAATYTSRTEWLTGSGNAFMRIAWTADAEIY